MGKHGKNILLTIVIGSVIFLIGNIFYNDFRFNSPQEFLYSFGMYQLYSFVLGFSNMYFFTWMEGLNWKPNDKIKRIFLGLLGSVAITLLGLFLLRLMTALAIEQIPFDRFIQNETWGNYSFGLWITLTLVIFFHVFYFYNKF
ncbi:MAG: histidine kinase, partial [Mangrovimonas sp.]|nr:histidine kinase [Mangrovimonas sp.]MCB0470180.1 histidine kinase [Flavobacteriaceae bacterium]